MQDLHLSDETKVGKMKRQKVQFHLCLYDFQTKLNYFIFIYSAVCSSRDPEQRMDCGLFNKTECKRQGCCYDNTVSGVPWCFNKPDVDSPDYSRFS